jgi:hypothetical protein
VLRVDLVPLVVLLDEVGTAAPPFAVDVVVDVVVEDDELELGLGAGAVVVGAPLPPPQPAISTPAVIAAAPRNLGCERFITSHVPRQGIV